MEAVTLVWPGGEHRFALRIGELRALQEARDAGPEEILGRIRSGTWRIDDLTQTIRYGLVGGEGMDSAKAAQLITSIIDFHPLAQFRLTAMTILLRAMLGPGDDEVGKPEGAASPRKSGSSPPSTETAQ